MNPIEGLRNWWQQQTGEEETPFDGDAPVWVISMVFHLVLMLLLAVVHFNIEGPNLGMNFVAPVDEPIEEFTIPDEFHFDERINEKIGAHSTQGIEMALALAPELSDISVVPTPVEIDDSNVADIEINQAFEVARGLQFSNLPVKGHVGEGTTGAVGAIDRVTHEILLSLEERKTLVVWLFDQSGSLAEQRTAIHDRFDRIYEELGVIEAAGNPAFAKHDDKPLLTSVVAFGNTVTLRTKKPTDNIAEIKAAVAEIDQDESGVEKVFSAIYMAVNEYKDLRVVERKKPEPERNVMVVVFTDEVGDDQDGLDQTIKQCRRYEVPVYVVGVPAPFGRKSTLVKWVDPDPTYDQTPQWGQVDQGPESFLPERVKLHFAGEREDEDPIDSGFGPYSLTRLCYETGGIYFAVHPNRNVNRAVNRNETAAFSAHIKHFFDQEVMRKYRPDYVSKDEYWRRVQQNKARIALIKAAEMSSVTAMDNPRLRFEKRDEAAFANALTEAQKDAAKLEPKIAPLAQTLELGESEREKETSLRWQAGYDLALGRVLAVKVRAEGYNAMLAQAKRGMKFEDEKNNTWMLEPSDEVSTGSQMARSAEKAKMYLERVVDEHPGTPWALLAQRELEMPLGWKWTEEFTPAPEARPGNAGNNNNNNAPPNDQRNMIKRPEKRRVPKL